MTRPLRIEFPGAVYHITSRGNTKQLIFLDEEDRKTFLNVLSSVVTRFNWVCHAYCLMNNHYHVLIETPEGNLTRGMRQLNGVYTQIFNQRHQRTGHLYQGRYGAILVEKQSHLLSLCRYVGLNPVRAKLVSRPEQWRWSSYRATLGEARKPGFLTTDWILSQFGHERREATRRYRMYLREGVGMESPWKEVKGQVILGTDGFLGRFRELLGEKAKFAEVPRVQRYVARPSLEELFHKVGAEGKQERDEAIYTAYVQHGYMLREIAEFLGVHYTTISRGIRRIEGRNRGT